MHRFDTPDAMREWSDAARAGARRVAFVPTMGALHAGHTRLVQLAHEHGDVVVVSIFVNPLQFDRGDDFDRYPRPVDDDIARCAGLGAPTVYVPTPAAMYPEGFETHVDPGRLAEPMEGAMRPGHFRGVTTVVTKLFGAVRPHVAVFGQKDYQQLAIIRRMTLDLDLGVEIVSVPTVREADGLALSSRNARLTPEDRRAAVVLPRALAAAAAAYAGGARDAATIIAAAHDVFVSEPRARVEYLEVADAITLQPLVAVDRPAIVAGAAWFLDIRLIDNVLVS